MLIVLGRNRNNDNNGDTRMNLTGVANPHITGNVIITADDVHTHDWIDHPVTTPPARTVLNSMVIHADTNRLG